LRVETGQAVRNLQFTLQLSGPAHALVQEYATGCFQRSVHLRSFRQLSYARGQCSVTAVRWRQGFCTFYTQRTKTIWVTTYKYQNFKY